MQRIDKVIGSASRAISRDNAFANKPVVSFPSREAEEICPVCKNAGFTNSGLQDGRSTLVPCPRCTPVRYAQKATVRQAQLVDRLFGGSQIPYKARNWEFSTFPDYGDQDARALVEHFVQSHRDMKDEDSKRGLWLAGPLGRGKTGLSICALKEFIGAGYLSLFVSTPELMDRLRATFGKGSDESQDELLKVVTDVPFLVLDDLGVEKPTTYVLEKFYLIIDKRQSRGLYTILTSNLSTKDLEAYWRPSDVPVGGFHPGLRIVERIREYCSGISIKGGNLRETRW